jgi:transposase
MRVDVITNLGDALSVIRELQEIIRKQTAEISKLKEQNTNLFQENAWLKKQLFGSKSEHFVPSPEGTDMLPGFEFESVPVENSEISHVSSHDRKAVTQKGWTEIPDDLPREERIIDIPEEERIGLKFIGYDESERIAYRSGLYVIRFKRAKYVSQKNALAGVTTAPAPGDFFDTSSGKTKYDISFVAKIVADKVENSIPLERQARILRNEGFPVAPSSLEYLYKNTASCLQPLYARLVSNIMESEVLHVDETFLKMLSKGLGKCQSAYLWCRMTGVGPPMIAFHFAKSRSHDIAEQLLSGYSGTIIRDAYAGYNSLSKCETACCWAHVRRKFFEANEAGFTSAENSLKLIRALYEIERVAKERAEEQGTEIALFRARKIARRDSQKIVKEFFAQCLVMQNGKLYSSLLQKAVTYALNIEKELKMFLRNPKLNIDNNPAEQAIRPIAIGRKNWLFAGSESGGQNLAILYSFAATCKANQVNFRLWLQDVISQISSTPASMIDNLLPHNWQPTQ